jgi:predicted nucleic acid-binding protein
VIVVDTNVIAYLCLPGERTLEAEKVFEADAEWIAPRLWRSEFLNVLSFYLRQGKLDLRKSFQIFETAAALVRSENNDAYAAEILELASRSGASAYDCEFIVLAKKMKISLITLDKALLRFFPDTAVSPKTFLAL